MKPKVPYDRVTYFLHKYFTTTLRRLRKKSVTLVKVYLHRWHTKDPFFGVGTVQTHFASNTTCFVIESRKAPFWHNFRIASKMRRDADWNVECSCLDRSLEHGCRMLERWCWLIRGLCNQCKLINVCLYILLTLWSMCGFTRLMCCNCKGSIVVVAWPLFEFAASKSKVQTKPSLKFGPYSFSFE